MIKFQNVSKYYEDEAALRNINLEIRPKEFVSLAGQSGAGKTTLLRILIAEEKPTEGYVYFDGIDVHSISSSQIPYLRRQIGVVFQDCKLLQYKNVFENLSFAMEVAGCSAKDIEEDVPQVLRLVGLEDKTDHFPHQLSGGEKQRVAIGRALVHRPKLIIADEPTGNLDLLNTWEIVRLLNKINSLGTTVILATHDREIINQLGKRVITLDKGKLLRDEEEGRYVL